MGQHKPARSGILEPMRDLATRASIEISARELRKRGDAAVGLLRGRETFLPWTPNLTAEDMIEATAFARSLGLTPVPHIAVRRVGSKAAARSLFARLAECGAEAVFLIGGDVPVPAGPFRSSFELLCTGVVQESGIRKFGVAGYPEGHPGIDEGAIGENLDLKLDYARDEGLDVFVVSQMCFDETVIADWAIRLRARGVTAPVRAGIAGPTNAVKLIEIGVRCGVGNSIRALKGKMGSVLRLVSAYEPQELIEGIAAARLDALSVHLFAFGGAVMTAQWMEKFEGGAI